MRAVRLAGFLAFAAAAFVVFLVGPDDGGLDARIPALLVLLVLVVVWHFVTAPRVREVVTTEVVTEEIITEIDLPRPAEPVLDLTDGSPGGARSGPASPAPPPARRPTGGGVLPTPGPGAGQPPRRAGTTPEGLPPTQGNLHGGPLPPGPSLLPTPGPPSTAPAVPAWTEPEPPIRPTEVLPPGDGTPPIRPTDEQFDLDAPAPGAPADDPAPTSGGPAPGAPVVGDPASSASTAGEVDPAPSGSLPPASPAPPPDAWTKWAADLFDDRAS